MGWPYHSEVRKIRRYSDKRSVFADVVSKGNIGMLQNEWPMEHNLVALPNSIIQWIRDPIEDIYHVVKVHRDLLEVGLEVGPPKL